jgi:hypothetical protein
MRLLLVCLIAAGLPGTVIAGPALSVGQVEIDPPTIHSLGVSLPITGDDNHNATVTVSYRKVGASTWKQALPLLRVHPEQITDTKPEDYGLPRPGEQFAGSIFDLEPNIVYELELDVIDPDGGSTTRAVTAKTRPLPLIDPPNPRIINVSSASELSSALTSAQPGDVITLADGIYNGTFSITQSGVEGNPIIVRGQSQGGTIINAVGAVYGVNISGSYTYVENLTIKSSEWGARIQGSAVSNVVVRNVRITDVFKGIDARRFSNRNFYICDNVLEGKGAVWPDTSQATWNYEGIVITGQGHVVCHNTLSGFGDALGMHHDTDIPNRAIDIYGNEVLWGGDDGIELDYGERNVRAFRNRTMNTNSGISMQPLWGGPGYAFRNVIYNTAETPFKLKNDPTGIYIFHNTAIRGGWAWRAYSSANIIGNLKMYNNVMVGTGVEAGALGTMVVDMTSKIPLGEIDYNGWSYDGGFKFDNKFWADFNAVKNNSPYENSGVLLSSLLFANTVPIPSSFDSFLATPVDVTLHTTSSAVNAGLLLPNINDDFNGSAPDLGAYERGTPSPTYGVRPTSGAGVRPSPPTGLRVQ